MNPIQLLAALDAALTLTERIGAMVAEAKKEGLITPEEQAIQLSRIEELRESLK